MYHLIGNPVSGRKKGYKAIEKLETFLKAENIPYDKVVTEKTDHASALATEICERCIDDDVINIVAIGGDGTFNEVLNGIIDFDKVNLGLIPAGSGNDFARYAKLSKNPVEAFREIIKHNVRKVDIYDINESRLGLNVAGTGLDIEVLKRHEKAKVLKGKFGYLCSLIASLAAFKPYKVKVSFDGGEPTEHTCVMVGVCNGMCIGGGMKLSPNSTVFDGKLNLVFAHTVKRFTMPFQLTKFLNGKYLKSYFGEEHLAKEVEIELIPPTDDEIAKMKNKGSQRELFINVDGQIVSDTPFKVKVLPAKLQLFCSEAFITASGAANPDRALNS